MVKREIIKKEMDKTKMVKTEIGKIKTIEIMDSVIDVIMEII